MRITEARVPTMSIISLIIILAVIGLLLWAVNTYLPMDAKIKKIMNIVVLIAVCLWLLYAFGILPIGDAKIPKIR